MRIVLFFLSGLAAGVSFAQVDSLVLTGATLYDGTGAPPVGNAVLHIDDGRLVCVGTADSCPVPAGAKTVDLAGRYVTPGLVDAHVHFSQTGWLDGRPDSGIGTGRYDYEALQRRLRANPDRWHRAYLCTGITAVFDPGGMPWSVEAATGQAPAARTDRVHLQAAGPLITHYEPIFPILSFSGGGTFLPMQTDEDALASVQALVDMGADAVKVWYLAPPEDRTAELDVRLLRIGEAVRARGLRLVVHATSLREAKVALRAGADMLVHSVSDREVDDEFLQLARSAGTYYAPTIAVGRNWRRAHASAALGRSVPVDDPNGCVDAETLRLVQDAAALRETLPEDQRNVEAAFRMLETTGRGIAVMQENLRRVHAAGIPITTATDAGNPLTLHGPSIYAEMELMVEAGLSPRDVLVMSTRNGAAFMGLEAQIGTLEAGKLADLIVLAEDPGASTSAYRTITYVMRAGELREIAHYAAVEKAPRDLVGERQVPEE